MKKAPLILACATIGIGISIGIRHHGSLRRNAVDLPTPALDVASKQKHDEEEQRKIAWRIIAPRMEIAQEEANKSCENRIQQIRDFFNDRQKHVPEFANRVLSFRSQWELGKSKVPGGDKDAHKRFLKAEFARIVFSDADLGKAITGATEDYVRDIQAIENALLVKIRADLQDFPQCDKIMPDLKTEDLFRERFNAVASDLARNTATDMKVDVGQLVGDEIATAIAIRVGIAAANRLGISAGILGTGTAFSPETVGVSILGGLIIDQIAGWVIGWYYHPEAEIGKKLDAEIAGLASLIIDGDPKTSGLKQEFSKLAERRKLFREAALREMILQTK